MIKILPYSQVKSKKININRIINKFGEEVMIDELLGNLYYFTDSGREAIKLIMELEGMQRKDEVFISTTTNSSFVSTCVSATIFNYSRISRVLTKDTKIIFVIHSFGFPNPHIFELKKIAEEKRIILVEDCAFMFDSIENGKLMGTIGDYVVYSLSKIFPMKAGGILRINKKQITNKIKDNNIIKKEALKYFKLIKFIRNKRQKNYLYIKNALLNVKEIYSFNENINPFMFGFYSKNYKKLLDMADNELEFGLTHVPYEVHIPLNPFIDIQDYDKLLERLIPLLKGKNTYGL